jgi:hypothetical protein
MDRAELYELWQRNKDRPAFVRNYREEIHEHTDTEDPIPDGSLFQVRQWLDSYKGVVTRQLNDDTDGTDPKDQEPDTDADGAAGDTANGETDTPADAEGGA